MKRIREFGNQSRLNSGLVYILLWGTPFFLLVTVWRYFTDQEPAFDNHLILLLMSLIGGFFFGLLVWAKDKNTETTT